MAEHTPGPWRVEEGTTLVWGKCNPDDQSTYGMGYPVAVMEKARRWDGGGNPSLDEQIANARLIAAAPDLLAALEAAVGVWAHRSTDEPQRVWLDMTRTAIARARGDA